MPPIQEEVLESLRERASAGSLPLVTILPREIENGFGIYSESSTYAVKDARSAGIDAGYLHDADKRRYLGEHSAEFLIAIAISFAADLGADGLKMVGSYILTQVRSAVRRGILGSADEAHVRINAAVIDVSADNIHIEGLEIEGIGDEAVAKLLDLVSDALTASKVKKELGVRPIEDTEESK